MSRFDICLTDIVPNMFVKYWLNRFLPTYEFISSLLNRERNHPKYAEFAFVRM